MPALISPPAFAPTSEGELATTATHHWVAVKRPATTGKLAWDMDQAKLVRSRKEGEDDLGTGGTQTINFDSGLYDNKRLILNATPTLTLSATRGGWYSLKIASSSSTARYIDWAYSGGDTLASGWYWPSFIDSTLPFVVDAYYSNGVWYPQPIKTRQKTVDGTLLSGSWTPDMGDGLYMEHVVTGSTPAGVTLQLPAGLPLNETAIIHFATNQASGFNVSASFAKLGVRPDYNAKTTLGIHRNTDGYQIRGLDVETWTLF